MAERFDWVAALDAMLAETGMTVRFWCCLQPDHRMVTWTGDVATCDICGLTSEQTREFAEGIVKITEERLQTESGHQSHTGTRD